MTTEQIDLATVKTLIESAKQLKSQLTLMSEQLDKVTAERDALTQQVQEKTARFQRDKEKEKVQHAAEIQSLKNETERQITELNSSSEDKLQSTIKQYQSQLQETIERYESQLENTSSQYEEKLKASRDELTKKNVNLLSELQQTQKNHQAVINRIRGLSS